MLVRRKIGVIEDYVIADWGDSALVHVLWHEVEVVSLWSCYYRIDNSARVGIG